LYSFFRLVKAGVVQYDIQIMYRDRF